MMRPKQRGAAARPPASLLRLNRHNLVPILVVGGTGSERAAIARAFHRASPHRDLPFLALDCRHDAPVLECALECWLLPVCTRASPNPLDAVAGGTLFLDWLGWLSAPRQQRLLLLAHRIRQNGGRLTDCLPSRLASGSPASASSSLHQQIVPDLLDCLDKIRVEVGDNVPDAVPVTGGDCLKTGPAGTHRRGHRTNESTPWRNERRALQEPGA